MYTVAPTMNRAIFDQGLHYNVVNPDGELVCYCYTQEDAYHIASCCNLRDEVRAGK